MTTEQEKRDQRLARSLVTNIGTMKDEKTEEEIALDIITRHLINERTRFSELEHAAMDLVDLADSLLINVPHDEDCPFRESGGLKACNCNAGKEYRRVVANFNTLRNSTGEESTAIICGFEMPIERIPDIANRALATVDMLKEENDKLLAENKRLIQERDKLNE